MSAALGRGVLTEDLTSSVCRITGYSCAGERGPENEDAFAIRFHPRDPACALVALADGQGGREGGAIAARLACRAGVETASNMTSPELLQPVSWSGIFQAADAAVHRHPAAGFTTLVIFCIASGVICGCSNGDSAAVLVDARHRAEILTARQPKNPPVGSGNARFTTFCAKLVPPWTVLALSDGVWKYTGWTAVFEAAARYQGDALIDYLRGCARLPFTGRLQDDFTLVVARRGGRA